MYRCLVYTPRTKIFFRQFYFLFWSTTVTPVYFPTTHEAHTCLQNRNKGVFLHRSFRCYGVNYHSGKLSYLTL